MIYGDLGKSVYDRTLWLNPDLDNPDRPYGGGDTYEATVETATLVSSLKDSGLHSPVLDIDFPARLVESSTPGHFHLYLDGLTMSWPKYVALLGALAAAGVIEEGFFTAALSRGMTLVRLPHVKKPVQIDEHDCDGACGFDGPF